MEREDQPHQQKPNQIKQHDEQISRQQGLRKKKQLQQKALESGMTYNQLKKLEKRQKWEEQKIVKRKDKREVERQRKKQKKLQQHANKQQQSNLKQSQHELLVKPQQQHGFMRKRKDEYQQKMKDGLKVVIDLQFYDLMVEKQLNSLVKQLSYCHAINRKMQNPFNFILTSLTEQRQTFMDQKYNAKKWGINFIHQVVHEAFKIQDLVYLTGDAQQQIEQFDDTKIYIIGGIVDHNRLKKITYDYAKQHNIAVRRLPLKNIKLKTNVHLAVNHVWEWMLRKYNGETWDQSLEKVLPERKIQKVTAQ